MASPVLESFLKKYHKFQAIDGDLKIAGGSLVTKVNLSPNQTFELLEVIYGEYKDPFVGIVFVDEKSTWERFFKTPHGILRVYDYRGSVSIGFSGKLTKALKKDASILRENLENAFSEFQKIKPKIISEAIKDNPLLNFTQTFLAVNELRRRAATNKSLLEHAVLDVSFIDAQLRFGLILKRQIDNKNTEYEYKLIYQEKNGDFYSERQIFSMALKEKLLSKTDYTALNKYYDLRNAAVHRYFISSFEYNHLIDLILQLEILIEKLGKKLGLLERKQVKLGVGMTTPEALTLTPEMAKGMIRAERVRIDSSKPIAIVPKRKRMFPGVE
jgi:hypothetical protein